MSSATDVNPKEASGTTGLPAPRTMRPNPLAFEVPVSVTGARPAQGQGNRELFTEETNTVLIFRDGAVIHLVAAVTLGQLLFLTEKKSKREVVCQVVHKRSHRPTNCYVEVEFTEAAENFWGVTFPAETEVAQLPAAVEAIEAEEVTEEDRSEPVAAPKSEDVAQLKDEVEALRAQLRELKEKQASEEARFSEEKKAAEEREAQARRLAEAEAAARAAAEAEARQKAEEAARLKAERAQAERAEAEKSAADTAASPAMPPPAAPAPSAPVAAQEEAAPEQPQRIGMRLPTAGLPQIWTGPTLAEIKQGVTHKPESAEASGTPEADLLEELLPKPALDFTRAPKGLDPNDPYNIYKPLRRKAGWQEILAAGVIVTLLVLGGGFAWYKNLIPFQRNLQRISQQSSGAPGASGNTGQQGKTSAAGSGKPSSDAGGETKAETPAASGTEKAASAEGTSAAGSVPLTDAPVSAATSADSSEEPEKNGGGRKAAAAKETSRKTAQTKPGKNHGRAETQADDPGQAAPGPSVPDDAPLVPAKLLNAVPPVYPPDAMRNYITGDVRIEAQLDTKGHVGDMKVLVGPSPLRQAAMDALKQYEYTPATQGGKPVASKVTVTIKFWFNP